MISGEMIKLILETEGVEGLKKLAEQATETAKALSEVGESAETVEKKTLDLDAIKEQGRGLLSSIVSGSADLPSVIKGVGDLMEYVPVIGTFGKWVRKAGEASEYAWPMMKDLYKQWEEGEEALKQAATDTKEYGERLDDLGESVKNLTDHEKSLTYQRERGAEALANQKRWHDELAKLPFAQREKEKKDAAERASELQKALSHKEADVVEAVAVKMASEEERELDKERSHLRITDEDTWEEATAKRTRESEIVKRQAELQRGVPEDVQQKARQLVTKAMIGGQEDAIREIVDYLPEKPKAGERGGEFRRQFEQELPEEKAKAQEIIDDFSDMIEMSAQQIARMKEQAENLDRSNQDVMHWKRELARQEEQAAADDAKAIHAAALKAKKDIADAQIKSMNEVLEKIKQTQEREKRGAEEQEWANKLMGGIVTLQDMQERRSTLVRRQVSDIQTRIQETVAASQLDQ